MRRERVRYIIDKVLWQHIFQVYRHSKERYCHSTVVAMTYMYRKRVRYLIDTALWQHRFEVYGDSKKTLIPQHCGSNDLYV